MIEESGKDNSPAATGNGAVRLERNARGELVARLPGRDELLKDVRVARCFPWSQVERFLSVRNADGKEIALLETLDAVDPDTRRIIEEELAEKVFVPKIRRIADYKAEFGVVSVSAETDRGDVSFQLRNRDDVRVLAGGRALFRDVDGNVYEVTNYSALDRASQKHIEEYF